MDKKNRLILTLLLALANGLYMDFKEALAKTAAMFCAYDCNCG